MMWKSIIRWWRKLPLVDLVLPVLAATAVRLFLILRWPHFAYEDALITFRYAENLAKGIGFVYNPGERVLGSTAPLYGLILALFNKFNLDIFVWSGIFNLACDIVLIYLLAQILMSIEHPARRDISTAVALLIGTYFPFLRVTVSRMETSLFLCLVIIAIWCLKKNHLALLGIVLGGLVLTRIDGLLLLGIILAWLLWQRRSIPSSLLVALAAVLIPYGLATTLYFGSPIPHSAIAKAVIYPQVHAEQFSRLQSLIKLMHHVFMGNFYHRLFLIPLALIGLNVLMRAKNAWFIPLLAWFILYFVSLGLSNTFIHEWYLAPPLLVYVISAGSGIGLLGHRLLFTLKIPSWGRSLAIVLFTVILILINGYVATDKTDKEYRFERNVRQNIGLWLRERANSTQSVLLEPIGYIGYYSGLRVYDAMGLISPQAIVYFMNYGAKDYMIAWALEALPDFVVLRPHEFQQASPMRYREFLHRYELVMEVSGYDEITSNNVIYMVFRRRN